MKLLIKFIYSFLLILIISSCNKNEIKQTEIISEIDTLSYALGVDFANQLKNSGLNEINYLVTYSGLVDVFEENELKMDKSLITPYIRDYFVKLRDLKPIKNLEEGREFLEKNKERDGINVTESGLQYEIIREGTGISPSETDIVKCHYHGTLIDGTVFDSSIERGDTSSFPLNKVMKGWTEGFQLMKEGAKYKFYIPSELAYGRNGRIGSLEEPYMVLIYEIELFEVVK